MTIKILIADDEESVRWVLSQAIEDGLEENVFIDTATNGTEALNKLVNNDFDVAFLDINMPKKTGLEVLRNIKDQGLDTEVVIITAQDNMQNAIEAMRSGALDYLPKPFEVDMIPILAKKAHESRMLQANMKNLLGEVKSHYELNMVAKSDSMREVFKTIGMVARSNVTSLILGESGTGKELVARSIHFASDRAARAFVALNTAAIPHELLESELMGHEKGAFTGADSKRIGKVGLAEGGTLFLDEVTEMPPGIQVKLLRLIQEREYYPLGSQKPQKADVRIIAASNRNIEDEVKSGRFREDLYYRLKVVPIAIPPLRERRDDIEPLVEHFLAKHAVALAGSPKRVSSKALKLLKEAEWKGNVRELEHSIMRAITLSRGPVLSHKDFPELTPFGASIILPDDMSLAEMVTQKISPLVDTLDDVSSGDLYALVMNQVEKPLIELTLKKAGNNQLKAARALGINRNTLRKKIRLHNIKI